MTWKDIAGLIPDQAREDAETGVIVVGVRGYYKRTMGQNEFNERGIYDDAFFTKSSTTFMSFNGNVDPSAYRKGHGTGSSKGMADLKIGYYKVHTLDLHNGQYLALCQRAGPVTVIRDGNPPYEDTGMFGINIHKGGFNTTSSLGCQTLHPNQWGTFINLAKSEMGFHKQKIMPYCLIEV